MPERRVSARNGQCGLSRAADRVQGRGFGRVRCTPDPDPGRLRITMPLQAGDPAATSSTPIRSPKKIGACNTDPPRGRWQALRLQHRRRGYRHAAHQTARHACSRMRRCSCSAPAVQLVRARQSSACATRARRCGSSNRTSGNRGQDRASKQAPKPSSAKHSARPDFDVILNATPRRHGRARGRLSAHSRRPPR